jgi:ABC-2 type transport system ATP-binding protein
MRRVRQRVRLLMIGAIAGALLAGVPAQADAAFSVSTYSVPVTTPDTLGAPVSLDTDVYVPDGTPPPAGFPLLEMFHGGSSTRDNAYDAAHARRFADDGYVVLSYSARGHGNSGGQTTVAGPAEMRDLFDVTAWALGIGGRDLPPHPDFHIDRRRIALAGYSQGGLHTNLGQVWSGDASVNPYGISFRALEPGNTPDLVFQALVPNSVLKLSFGVGLVGTYLGGSTTGRLAPVVDKWIATAAADEPQLYGSGDLCDRSTHDTATSTMQQDLAWRSVGCQPERLGLPWLWAQAFDDGLFTPDMAISMWRRAPNHDKHRLYLSMGGHAAPAADQSVEQDKLDAQRRFLDAVMQGRALPRPNVVYWTRDPTVEVHADSYAYPPGAWRRQTADDWPPAKVADATYRLGADGSATQGSASSGVTYLSPLTEDERNDPVAAAALSGTPLGTSPLSSVPATSLPGFIASFRTPPFSTEKELSGAPFANLNWTPAATDSQLVLELFDEDPSGKLTLFSRGVQGLRGTVPGVERRVRVDGNAFSIRIPAGHRVRAWVMAGNQASYKPYPTSAGGVLRMGDVSTLALPLRSPPRR